MNQVPIYEGAGFHKWPIKKVSIVRDKDMGIHGLNMVKEMPEELALIRGRDTRKGTYEDQSDPRMVPFWTNEILGWSPFGPITSHHFIGGSSNHRMILFWTNQIR